MSDPLVQNAADPEQVRDAGRKTKHSNDRDMADLRAVMDSPAGRRVVWNLLQKFGLHRQPFTGSGPTTDFRCGETNAALFLYAQVNQACPDLYLTMLAEVSEPKAKK